MNHWILRITSLDLLLALHLLLALPAAAGTLELSWSAPATNADGSALTDLAGYRVYYGTSAVTCPGGSTFATVPSATAHPAAGTTVSYRLTGLTAGTTYVVGVTAVDLGGNESACASASGVARTDFALSPAGAVNFGSVSVGHFADKTFTVTNTGAGTIAGAVTTSAPFSVVSGSPFTLVGAGASQVVTVRFHPTTSVTATTNVNFTADGATVSTIVTGGVTGATSPTVAVKSPSAEPTYTTSQPLLTLQGTASIGVTQVTWVNERSGLEGTASGTTNWRVAGIVLQPGPNVLTVTARNATGDTGTARVTIMSCRSANDFCR